MAKHLSLSERALIERTLVLGRSFSEIAASLNRSPSTISREVKQHRAFVSRWRDDKNDCLAYSTCLRRNLCPTETIYSCIDRCKFCREYDCRTLCPGYQSPHCPKLEKPPYVCTGCEKQKTCKRNHAYYTAHRANAAYKKELRDARIGSAQIRNGCWRSASCCLRSLPRGSPLTTFWLPTRMRLVCRRRPSTTISIPMLSLSRTLICPRKLLTGSGKPSLC